LVYWLAKIELDSRCPALGYLALYVLPQNV